MQTPEDAGLREPYLAQSADINAPFQEITMAKPPAAMPAPAAMPDDAADKDGAGAAAAGGADAGGQDDEGDSDHEVLLTVCKEADGTYSLIKGDEDDAGEESAGGPDANEQTFDSKGALLKGILDILNEDEQSEGGEGSAGDQFQAGFDENAPAKPAAPMPQKY